MNTAHPTIQSSDLYVQPLLQTGFIHREQLLTTSELLTHLAEIIRRLPGGAVKVISLVGGAASGKTTLTRQLVPILARDGLAVDCISTDDYTLGDRKWRWAHFEGKKVRDPLGKWDFELLNSKINDIRANRDPHHVVKVPTYDPATGLAIAVGEEKYTHAIGPLDVLLVEGDVFRVKNPDLAVYLHVPDHLRLQNRIARDVAQRSAGSPEAVARNFNLRHGNQHVPHTLPAAQEADVVITGDFLDEKWYYNVFESRSYPQNDPPALFRKSGRPKRPGR